MPASPPRRASDAGEPAPSPRGAAGAGADGRGRRLRRPVGRVPVAGTTGRGAGAAALARRVFLPLVAVVVATAIFGLPHLRAIESQQSSAYVADPMQLELERAPAWFGGDVEADVRAALAAL